jgi:hypothetical protein
MFLVFSIFFGGTSFQMCHNFHETRSRSNIAEKIAYLELKYILIRVYKKRFQAPVMFIIHPHGVGSNQFLSVNIGVIRLLSVITTTPFGIYGTSETMLDQKKMEKDQVHR